MRISIITPTYNRQTWIKETIIAILRQDTAGAEVEYLVVDNNSTDDTRSIVNSFATQSQNIAVKYIFEPRQGVNQARNTGIDAATGDYLLFLDDDLVFEPGVLSAYVNAFRKFPEAKIFGGRISVRPPDFQLPPWLTVDGPYARTMIVLRMEHGTDSHKREIDNEDMPVGPSMAFQRSVFNDYGAFRTDFGLVGNSLVPGAEYELLLRLKSRGIQEWVYVGEARTLHPIKPSQAKKAYFRERLFGVGRVFYRLHPMEARWKILGLPAYILEYITVNMAKSLGYTVLRKPVEAFYHECEVQMFRGYVYQHFQNRRVKS